MQAQRGSRDIAVVFLTHGVRWGLVVNTIHPAALSPVKSPDTCCTGGWVGSRACLEGCGEGKICCATEVRTPNRPAYSDLLTD